MNLVIVAIVIIDVVVFAVYSVHMLMFESEILWYVSLGLELLLIAICLVTLFVYLRQYHERFHKIPSE